jgi:hypothetical protein
MRLSPQSRNRLPQRLEEHVSTGREMISLHRTQEMVQIYLTQVRHP